MTARGLSRLHFIPQGKTVNSEYYIHEILEKEVKPLFRRRRVGGLLSERKLFAVNKQGVFQQDGARAHTSKATVDWININLPSFISPADWPPNSPDLSPIENIWSIISTSTYRDPEPKTVTQLQKRLRHAWSTVSSETLSALIESMPDRLKTVRRNRGGTILY
jgi:hypothetical protein